MLVFVFNLKYQLIFWVVLVLVINLQIQKIVLVVVVVVLLFFVFVTKTKQNKKYVMCVCVQSTKISGLVLPIPNCSLIFDPKLKGVQLGFCLGLEFRDLSVVYLKAESAQIFNGWLRVSEETFTVSVVVIVFSYFELRLLL